MAAKTKLSLGQTATRLVTTTLVSFLILALGIMVGALDDPAEDNPPRDRGNSNSIFDLVGFVRQAFSKEQPEQQEA